VPTDCGRVPPDGDIHEEDNAFALLREYRVAEYITHHRPTAPFWVGETRLVRIRFR
jgi:hypothetical protein